MTVTGLVKARYTINDEWYTQMEDIEAEVPHFAECFRGQDVYLNCDDPHRSNFWRFFSDHFDEYGLHSLTATAYRAGAKTFTCYQTANGQTTLTEMKGDGDFRSAPCVDILHRSSIVVGNGPFSLFDEMAELLVSQNKDFLIIGNLVKATSQYIMPGMADNRIRIGHNRPKEFVGPDGQTRKFGDIVWYTTLPVKDVSCFVPDGSCCYDPERYCSYINCPAIDVCRLRDIPCDYMGLMGVPLSYLSLHNPEMFRIVGSDRWNRLCKGKTSGVGEMGAEWLSDYRKQGGTAHFSPCMTKLVLYTKEGKAKAPFVRILIQRIVPPSD